MKMDCLRGIDIARNVKDEIAVLLRYLREGEHGSEDVSARANGTGRTAWSRGSFRGGHRFDPDFFLRLCGPGHRSPGGIEERDWYGADRAGRKGELDDGTHVSRVGSTSSVQECCRPVAVDLAIGLRVPLPLRNEALMTTLDR